MNYASNKRRRDDVVSRVANADVDHRFCRIAGCGNPTRAGSNSGLNRLYCRAHEDYFQRHGSYVKGSYPASLLAPYRKRALAWLEANRTDRRVALAIQRIRSLYQRAGAKVEAFRLAGLSPEDRARAAWARLRVAEVDPMLPIAAWLAIERAIANDPQPDTKIEFKRVQAAKLVHRMASGTHKRWERTGPGGRVLVEEMHKYPASRGRVLRHIGEQLALACEVLPADLKF